MLNQENESEKRIQSIFSQKDSIKDLVKYDGEASKNFVDSLFPPDDTSIGISREEYNKDKYETSNIPPYIREKLINSTFLNSQKINLGGEIKYEWRRIPEVFPENYLMRIIKSDDELIDDVVQGDLGDCYFVSALSALAEKKERVFKILKGNDSLNNQGFYEVNAYVDGKPIQILLDDYFPVKFRNFTSEAYLAFSNIEEESKNIWPLLVEKAFAKVNGSYNNIIDGNVAEALEFLLPSPVEYHFHSTYDANSLHTLRNLNSLWMSIKKADEKDYIICCDISEKPNGISMTVLSSMGLIDNHAYTVISVHEVSTQSGENVQLLKIRNPWGSFEWNGDWSDSSDKWTQELKAELKSGEGKDDGIFFMAFKDYVRFFTCTYICKYEEGFNYAWSEFTGVNNLDSQRDQDVNFISVLISEDDKKEKKVGYFSISQKSSKIKKNLSGNSEFINLYASMTVFKKNENLSLNLIGCVSGRSDKLHLEAEIHPGEYLIIIKKRKHSSDIENSKLSNCISNFDEFLIGEKTKNTTNNVLYENTHLSSFVIGVYSQYSKVNFSNIPELTEMKHLFCLSLVNYAELQQGNKEYFYQEREPNTWRYMSLNNFSTDSDSFGFLLYNNESEAEINEVVTFKEIRNIKFIPLEFSQNIKNYEDNEAFYEDPNEDLLVKKLISIEQKQAKQNRNYNLIQRDSDLILTLSIPPHSYYCVIFEKTHEQSSLQYESTINLKYPLSYLWSERKFSGKKQRIKYKDSDDLDIFESIIKHPSGILFKYKNKTKNHKVDILINLDKIKNLKFNDNKELLGLYNEISGSKKKIVEIIQKDIDKEMVKISLFPGELIFAEFDVIDQNEAFSFSSSFDYSISLIS